MASADAEDEVLMLNVRNPRTDVLQLRVWDADTISKERLTKCSTFVERVPEAWQDDDIGHVANTSVTSVTAALHRFAVLILDCLHLDPASFQEIPLRQLLRRGSGSDCEKTTSAETVRFEDLHLGISWYLEVCCNSASTTVCRS